MSFNVPVNDLQSNRWGRHDLPYYPEAALAKDYEQLDYWFELTPPNDDDYAGLVTYTREHFPDYPGLPAESTFFEQVAEVQAIVQEANKLEDVVNHPSHYKTESGLEAIDVLEQFGLIRDGRLFNAGKYLLRAGKKDDEVQDLKKAVWYLNRYIAEQEAK